ncbi:site-specific integrase [Oscillospiraceae bacterium 21-37]
MAKRRANGEGNIRKRKDGRWEGRYTAGRDPGSGKAIYKNVLGKTQAEVKEKLARAIEDNKGLDIVKAGQYTVGQWMDVWFENYAKIKVRPSSHKTYKGYIENHIKPTLGKIPLSKLTTLEVQALYRKLLTSGRVERTESKQQPKGLSAKTVQNINQVISSAMELAKRQKLISCNPTDGCALPKVEHQEMKTLTADQLAAFFREAKNSGVFEMYYLELATGLRRGELLGLKWGDINLETSTIQIKRQIARINGEVVEAPLKTKNSYRTLSIGTDAVEILRDQRSKSAGEYVFPSPNGGPISPDSVLHMLHRVLERAGLPKIRFHDFRHTFSTLALQNGVDIKTVSGMLGHYSAGFTLDTYAHVTTAAQKEAAKTIDNLLSGSV